jgi:hypothetical protein
MTIAPKGYYCDVATRMERPILEMSPAEVLEREELNRENTATNMRAKMLAELSKTNENNGYSTEDRPLDERCHATHWLSGRCVLGVNHTSRHLAADEREFI